MTFIDVTKQNGVGNVERMYGESSVLPRRTL